MNYTRNHQSEYTYTVQDLIAGEIIGFDSKAYIPQIAVEIEYEQNLRTRIKKYSNCADINSIIYSYLKYELPGDLPGECYEISPRYFNARAGLSDKKLYYIEYEVCTWTLCEFSDSKTAFVSEFGPDKNYKGMGYHLNCWEVLAYLNPDLKDIRNRDDN
jgi:hypothetical protein